GSDRNHTPRSFPTRRSSDLAEVQQGRQAADAAGGDAPDRPAQLAGREAGPDPDLDEPADGPGRAAAAAERRRQAPDLRLVQDARDRKSTRLNSSHVKISYAV